ncbi:MAG: hypothetical protein QG656_358, partial [Candidatus Hydrogenedentes bacterium]|nr:hypothetical protein [Candidatus Hydrogenedentota bacterium]
ATPIEAAREALTVAHAVFVAVCPAQHTVLQTPAVLTKVESVSAAALVDAVFPRMKRSPSMASGSSEDPPAGARVYGMRHVVKTLDAIENGLLNDFSVIEMYACPEGCFGAPVWREDAYVAARRYAGAARWRRLFVEALGEDASANALQLVEPVEARTGVRLDPDMRKAIEKLRRIDVLTKALPGRNCGVCGAPTCAALAEDVVLGRVRLSACAYVNASLIELDRQGEDKP